MLSTEGSWPVRPVRDDSGSYAADQAELSQPTSYGVGPPAADAHVDLNLFSGADGWGVGAKMLGLSPIGIELDEHACATARAAGHLVVRQDVTTFSAANLRGRVRGLIGSPPCTDFSKAGRRRGLAGKTGPLVWEPLRVARECLPEWIALEQVPEVLPIWQQIAHELRWNTDEIGYSVWTGVLDAANYGVPQNRKRAILVGRRGSVEVGPPSPTHTEHPHPSLFGDELPPWVSMAEALGWGMGDRPSYTVTGGGAASGGPEPFGHAARKAMERRILCSGKGDRGRHESLRSVDRPAPAVALGHDVNSWEWRLDTHRDQRPDGTTQTRELAAPAPAVTGKAYGQWAYERPATTIMGDSRVFPPDGHHPYQGLGSWSARAIKVTLEELAVLQSFPVNYPFQGNKSQRSLQIGNAIPPLLAAHVLSAASGIPLARVILCVYRV